MSAALGTLPFIATLWLLLVLGARVLEESGGKIAAALKGMPIQPRTLYPARRIRVRWRCRTSDANPRWRAAA
jgi:hypothetical protein